MDKGWPKLTNPPIVLAVFEVKFNLPTDLPITSLKKNDGVILKDFPNCLNKFKGNFILPSPSEGLSTAKVDSTQVGYDYTTTDRREILSIAKDGIFLKNEGKYCGWDTFKAKFMFLMDHYSFLLEGTKIERVSVRFINNIIINDITDPLEYFNAGISSQEGVIEYPIDSYFYRYTMSVPSTPYKINVNHAVEGKGTTGYNTILDIDVLKIQEFVFDQTTISAVLEEIRQYKNQIFFKNITSKTLDLLQ